MMMEKSHCMIETIMKGKTKQKRDCFGYYQSRQARIEGRFTVVKIETEWRWRD